ncbi:PIG-L deacetylase family protein [Rhodophyticola porphyridii]|nr:PIG-L deacetylase family protein [Rhodophyticola porphyridii]
MSFDFGMGAGRVLVIAPHPDDEVLGAGGTMARLAAEGRDVHVCIVTSGTAPRFDAAQTQRVRAEAKRAHKRLGVADCHWLGFPAAGLSETPHADLNAGIARIVQSLQPEVVLLPHPGDIHLDHQACFTSSLVASRPHQASYPPVIMAYETLSETNWNAPQLTPAFLPSIFVDISETLEAKLDAFALYESQVHQAPHERSPESLRALATLRGATVHRDACEAFVPVRMVL